MLNRYRTILAVSSQPALAAPRRSRATLRDRLPDAIKGLSEGYAELLETCLVELSTRPEKPRETMARLAASLGDAGAGARDLVDMHLAALVEVLPGKDQERVRWLAIEGRLIALEMMGLLADYYRDGGSPGAGARYH